MNAVVTAVCVAWGVVFALIALHGCALFGPEERAHVAGEMNALEQCQEKGREGPDGGHIHAYDECLKEAGIQ